MALPYEQWTCNGCGHTTIEAPNHQIEERYSLGLYAGRWGHTCWDASGYRKEGREGFSPFDAGESYDEE